MPEHKQTYLKDYQIECDSDIASLIEILNKNGFKTFASCIGDRNERAYVMLEPDNLDKLLAIIPILVDTPRCICEIAKWVVPDMYRLVIRQNPSIVVATKSQWVQDAVNYLKDKKLNRN